MQLHRATAWNKRNNDSVQAQVSAMREQLDAVNDHNAVLKLAVNDNKHCGERAGALARENALLKTQMATVEKQKQVLNARNARLAGILEANSLDVHGEEGRVMHAEEDAVKEAYRKEIAFQEKQRIEASP